MKKILFCLSLSLCTLIPQVATALEAIREGRSLRFTGAIDEESEKVILQHLRSGASTLIVNSEGGDVGSGQAIAFEIIKQKANVIVDH
jgi:ATP-dependent protease ClpP protease subunit